MAKDGKRQLMMGAAAAVLLAVSVFIMMKPDDRVRSEGQYFYDLGKNEVYIEKAGVFSPVKLPSGNEGVAAAVYSCGSCDDPADHIVVYLTKHTDEYLKVLQSGEPPTAEQMQAGSLVRAPDGGQWIRASSDAAMRITQSVAGLCGGGKPAKLCEP